MSSKIEDLVSGILENLGINRIPIPIEKIALKMGLAVMPTDLGEGVSGALIIKDGVATIGVNRTESEVRRRFTIAHELAHFNLHHTANNLFITTQVWFRDENSSSGELRKERDANAFAAAILMPEKYLKDEIESAKNESSILNDDELIGFLSKKFKVSEIAMTYRLTNLGLVN